MTGARRWSGQPRITRSEVVAKKCAVSSLPKPLSFAFEFGDVEVSGEASVTFSRVPTCNGAVSAHHMNNAGATLCIYAYRDVICRRCGDAVATSFASVAVRGPVMLAIVRSATLETSVFNGSCKHRLRRGQSRDQL